MEEGKGSDVRDHLEDYRGRAKYIRYLKKPCDSVLLEVVNILLVIGKPVENVLQRIDLKGCKAFISKLFGLLQS